MADTKPSFVDNAHAPDLFASDISGCYMTGGNVAVTLERHRVNHGSPSGGRHQRVVVARLVLTAQAAQNMVVLLNTFLEQNGLSPSEAIKRGSTEQ